MYSKPAVKPEAAGIGWTNRSGIDRKKEKKTKPSSANHSIWNQFALNMGYFGKKCFFKKSLHPCHPMFKQKYRKIRRSQISALHINSNFAFALMANLTWCIFTWYIWIFQSVPHTASYDLRLQCVSRMDNSRAWQNKALFIFILRSSSSTEKTHEGE